MIEQKQEVQQTDLDSGLRVISQNSSSTVTSLCFLWEAGSAYETAETRGASQLAEFLAFKGTENRSALDTSVALEKLGAFNMVVPRRDSIVYAMDCMRGQWEDAASLMAESIVMPCVSEEEVAEARDTVLFSYDHFPPNLVVKDQCTSVAFHESPLGQSHWCSPDVVQSFSSDRLRAFREQHLSADRCVLAAVGVDHDALVRFADKHYRALPQPSTSASTSAATASATSTQEGKLAPLFDSRFVAAEMHEVREYRDDLLNLQHVSIAFNSGGFDSGQDFVAAALLQSLLGGGASFSAGGPGKGMYSRLYRNVLNKYGFVESIEAFLDVFSHHGIVGIAASAAPEHMGNVVAIMVHQILLLASAPPEGEELSRAKNMLKSQMLMNLESRMLMCEDLARQLVTLEGRISPLEMCSRIDSISGEQLQELAQRYLQGGAVYTSTGPHTNCLPQLKQVVEQVLSQS